MSPSVAVSPSEIRERAELAEARLAACDLCPRRCGANRLNGGRGACGIGARAVVSSVFPHFGEESPLVGPGGSGTIFFSGCNLHCRFCQNYDISHRVGGEELTPEELAVTLLALQQNGCHNVNFVTPSHVVPMILAAVALAAERGLTIPLVYNTSAYDDLDTLRLLDGIADVYMPDVKFWDEAAAAEYLEVEDYPEIARAALKEMHRQVGDLQLHATGLAKRGLLVRHLVMPEGLAGSRHIFRFLADELSPDTYVNVMDQYRPAGTIAEPDPIARRLTLEEFREALADARAAGLHRLDGYGNGQGNGHEE